MKNKDMTFSLMQHILKTRHCINFEKSRIPAVKENMVIYKESVRSWE